VEEGQQPRPRPEHGADRAGSRVPGGGPGPATAPGASTRRRLWRYAGWGAKGVGVLLTGILVLLGGLLLALQSGSLATSLVRRALAGALSSELRVELEGVKGSWVRGLLVTGVRVSFSPEGGDEAWVVTADTVSLSYRLLPLIRRTVQVQAVAVSGARVQVWMAERDSLAPEVPGDPREVDAGWLPAGWEVRVGVTDLHVAQLEIWEGERSAGPWTATDMRIRLGDFELGSTLALARGALNGSFRPPGLPEGTPSEWGRMVASGRVEAERVFLDSLLLESPESDVRVRGTLPLAMPGLAPEGVEVQFAADPLHVGDLGPLLPHPIADSIRLYARGEARTAEGVLLVELEADSRGAGLLEVQGEVRGMADDPALRGRARVEGLDLQAWGVSAAPLTVDGTLEVELEGAPEGATGSGSAQVALRHGAEGLDVRAGLAARSDSAGGPWRGEWSLVSPGVEANGTATVSFGDPLVSELEGRVSYDRYAGAPPIPGWDIPVVRGHVRWEGRGSSLAALDGRAELVVDTAGLNRTSVEGLVVAVETRLGQASFSLDGAVGGGRISARGGMDLLERSGHLLEARLDGVDVAALVGDSVPSTLSATASGSLESLSPLRASGSLRVLSAEYGEMRVDSALVVAEQLRGVTELRLEAAFPDSGRVRMVGRFDDTQGASRIRVDSLRFVHLDLEGILGDEVGANVPATDLTGTGVADLVAVPGGWEGRASLELASSRVGAQGVEEGLVTVALAGAEAQFAVDVHIPGGGFNVEARVEGLGTLPSVVIPQARFQAVDVGAFLGRDDLDLLLSGHLEGRLEGTRLDEMVGSGRLALEASRLASVPVETATLEIQVAGGHMEGTLVGRAAGGSARAEGRVVLAGMPDGPLEGRLWADVDSMAWEGVRLDRGRLRLSATDGMLQLDTLALQSPDGFFLAAGRLPLKVAGGRDGEIAFRGELEEADILAYLMGAEMAAVGSASLDGTITGALDDLTMEATATVASLLLDDLRVRNIELRAEARRTVADGFIRGSGTLGVDELNLPTLSVRRVDMDATLESGEDLKVTASMVMDDARDGSLSAQVPLAPAPLAVLLERLEFRADQDRWTLASPARIDLSDGIGIDSLELVSGDQGILARGRAGSHGPLDFRVDMRAFRMETVTDMIGLPHLRGPLSGVLAFGGTGEAPLLDATFSGQLQTSRAPPSEVTLTAGFADGTMKLEGAVLTESARRARVVATLPLDFSLVSGFGGLTDGKPILLEAAADSLSLEWVGLFLPSGVVRDLQGVLHGTVTVEGNPESPRFAGSLDLSGGSVRLPALGVEYRRAEARFLFLDDRVLLDSLRIRSGGGSLVASGIVALPRLDQPEFTVSVTAEGFHAIRTSGMDATASGKLDLSGTGFQLAVAGGIELERSEVQLGDMVTAPGVRTVTLGEEDYRELAQVFGYRRPAESGPPSDFFNLLSLDVDVRLRRDSWVRQRASPEMAVQFAGEVSVRKDPGGEILLVGMVESVPGRSYVEQFGRRFTIASGTLQFQGTPDATRVDLRAEYAVPSRDDPGASPVVVALDITGTPEDLRLELSSTPSLEPSDMVSYIVTGRPAGQTLGAGEGGSLTDAGEAFALGRLTGAVEAYAREQVGLDVVEITTDGLKGMILVAGRYVSPSLYLGIRQPLSLQRTSGETSEQTPDPELEAELEALRWLLLNLRADGRSGVEFFVRTRISYD